MTLMTFWRIWHVRNEIFNEKSNPPIEASRRFLCSYVESLLAIKQDPMADPVKGKVAVSHDHESPRERKRKMMWKLDVAKVGQWSRPQAGWVKLKADGAWVKETRQGGTNMILHDEEGRILFTAYRFLQTCDSPLEAELLA
jgi:hypothetical protein